MAAPSRFANRAWLLARRTAQEYSADNCSHMAAAISYYALFSIVPLVIFLVSIFGFIVRDVDRQEDIANEVVDFLDLEAGPPTFRLTSRAQAEIEARSGPAALDEIETELAALRDDPARRAEAIALAARIDAGEPVVVAGRELRAEEVIVRSDNAIIDTIRGVSEVSGPLALVGLAGLAWSASAMFGAVRKSINVAWDVQVHRPVVQQKLLDLGMVLGLALLLGLSIAGTAALRTLRELSDDALGPLSTGTGVFWSVLPLLLPSVFTFIVFVAIYRIVPNVTTRFRDVWPGALLATALFEALKNGYALYIAKFNNYAGAYGALGGVLLFLFFIYLAANILLIGAELAAEYPRVRRGDYDHAPQPRGPSRPLRERALQTVRGFFLHDRDAARQAEPPER